MRQKLIDEARAWLGVRFRHLGRTRNGVDCLGIMFHLREAVLGQSAAEMVYPRRPTSALVFEHVDRYADRISREGAGPGDVVLMNFGGESTHFGLLTDRGVLHANVSCRKVIEHTMTPEFRREHVVAYYRLKGVEPWRS